MVPEAIRILRDELPNIEIVISSQTRRNSPTLCCGEKSTWLFCGRKNRYRHLVFKPLIKEPLIAVLRSDHRLACA